MSLESLFDLEVIMTSMYGYSLREIEKMPFYKFNYFVQKIIELKRQKESGIDEIYK